MLSRGTFRCCFLFFLFAIAATSFLFTSCNRYDTDIQAKLNELTEYIQEIGKTTNEYRNDCKKLPEALKSFHAKNRSRLAGIRDPLNEYAEQIIYRRMKAHLVDAHGEFPEDLALDGLLEELRWFKQNCTIIEFEDVLEGVMHTRIGSVKIVESALERMRNRYLGEMDITCMRDEDYEIKMDTLCATFVQRCVNKKVRMRTELVDFWCLVTESASVTSSPIIEYCKCENGLCRAYYKGPSDPRR